jgi:hypothetical protein
MTEMADPRHECRHVRGKLRPADLPIEQRPVVVDRLPHSSARPRRTSTRSSTAGSTFDLVRIATDVDVDPRLIPSRDRLPGVEVAVEADGNTRTG